MNCRDATDFLMDYVARELAPEVCGEFELHLSRCSNCRVFLLQYRETILAGRSACAERRGCEDRERAHAGAARGARSAFPARS